MIENDDDVQDAADKDEGNLQDMADMYTKSDQDTNKI